MILLTDQTQTLLPLIFKSMKLKFSVDAFTPGKDILNSVLGRKS